MSMTVAEVVVVCRYVRISTWCGDWSYRPWAKPYCVGVEDPFDCTDNCARTIAAHASSSVDRKVEAAVQHILRIDPSTVSADASLDGKLPFDMLACTCPSCRLLVLSAWFFSWDCILTGQKTCFGS